MLIAWKYRFSSPELSCCVSACSLTSDKRSESANLLPTSLLHNQHLNPSPTHARRYHALISQLYQKLFLRGPIMKIFLAHPAHIFRLLSRSVFHIVRHCHFSFLGRCRFFVGGFVYLLPYPKLLASGLASGVAIRCVVNDIAASEDCWWLFFN